MTVTRLLRSDDAIELTELLIRNRDFLAPWDPVRPADWFTLTTQQQSVDRTLEAHAAGQVHPLVILDPRGGIAGRLNINGIVRGALQSGTLGYWVTRDMNGSGLATAAVSEAVHLAATDLQLHRLQAETLEHNGASRRVLEKNGFSRYGLAPKYLKIAGRWQDHVMYQRILS